jgi:hypothetical protein
MQSEAATLMGAAKKEAMDKITSALGELRFGFPLLRLGEGVRTEKGPRGRYPEGRREGQYQGRSVLRLQIQDCPPHDARRQRAQGAKKRPFTNKQLAEFGFKKV